MKTDEEILALNFTDWPLPDGFLVEIGRIASHWATLESFLNICLGKLAGFNDLEDPKAFILVTHSSFPQRLDVLSALCEQLEGEHPHLNGYQKVVQQLKQAQKLRNDFMHYGMSVDPETQQVTMSKGTARGTLKVGVIKVSVADIRRVTVAIHEGQLALYKLVLKRELKPIWETR
jgi:hypothetical protein